MGYDGIYGHCWEVTLSYKVPSEWTAFVLVDIQVGLDVSDKCLLVSLLQSIIDYAYIQWQLLILLYLKTNAFCGTETRVQCWFPPIPNHMYAVLLNANTTCSRAGSAVQANKA